MKRSILIALLIAVGIAGCGGSSKPSARACWTSSYRAEVAKEAPGNDAIDVASAKILLISTQAYAAKVRLPGWLPPYVRPWLRTTEEKCGHLS